MKPSEPYPGGAKSSTSLPSRFDDPHLLAAVQEYLTILEGGNKPDRQEFLAHYPEIADELDACLDGLAFVRSAVSALAEHPDLAAPPELENLLKSPLGDFRILREIGRGGMGVVYEAVQLSLGRRVALKVLPFAAALDAKTLQRFKNEAQAAAQLHHQHIVPVYAVGCERGVHFYAMHLVEGQSLAALIQELRDLVRPKQSLKGRIIGGESEGATEPLSSKAALTQPVGALSTQRSSNAPEFFRSVARLAMHAAEALEHAHKMGIVHRDIKPANLLLDQRETLLVTDFGLAQIQADANLTRSGDLLGTLRYMSPEQTRGKAVVLDHRTDIYSLGVTLYELLTLQPAFAGTDHHDLLRRIADEEPRPPRSFDRAIPLELETIVLKAMAKGPEERYGTAKEMANDLLRFLEDRPIRARRPTVREKAVKWSRRHRGVTLSAVVLLVLATAGSLATTLLLAQKQRETEAAFERERTQRANAENSFRQARAAVDFFTQVGEVELEGRPELVDVRQKMLEAALVYYRGFLDERRDDPTIQTELAQARTRVTALLGKLSAFKEFDRIQSQIYLLKEKVVQDDLKLSEQQLVKFADLEEDALQGPPPDLYRLAPEQKRRHFEERRRSEEAALAEILMAGQVKRLRQIYLQARGPFAFSEPEVVGTLGLNDSQKQAVQAIQIESRQARLEIFFRNGGPNAPHPLEQVWGSANQEVLALLTPEQKARWKEMVGMPLQGEIRLPHLDGPGRPPPKS